MNSSIIKTAAFNAVLIAIYVTAVGSFIFYVPKILGSDKGPDSVFAPIAMLCLLVFSAALTGFLMFGRPVMWYLEGKKKEAVQLLFYTLGILLIFTLAAFCLALLIGKNAGSIK